MSNVVRMEPSWANLIVGYVAHMGAAGLSRGTIDIRVYHLGRVAAGVGGSPASLTVSLLADWLARQDWKPNTRRAYRGTLRAFYSWAVLVRLVEESPAHLLPSVRIPRGRPRPVPEDAFRWALSIADERARLAIRLAGVCGLRRAEVAAARTDDLEADLLGWSLRVEGKGGHVRIVPVPDDLAAEIRRRPEGWLFPSTQGGHLTPHHLGKVISRNLPEDYATHSLRHRCGTQTLEAAGGNLRVVQEILGHADIRHTAIYTFVPSSKMREAVEAVA